MANIKTAISLQKTLFEQVETLAHEMKISRSRLFVMALEEYVHRHQNRRLLEKINQAYQSHSEATEQKHLRKMKRLHRRVVENEW
jgi:metal-responsive CopG/Arc/MetJ family transcriptional regulator